MTLVNRFPITSNCYRFGRVSIWAGMQPPMLVESMVSIRNNVALEMESLGQNQKFGQRQKFGPKPKVWTKAKILRN